MSHALWSRLADADPSVELVPVVGWIEAHRAVKEPAELERIEAACRVADQALEETLADIRPGVTEEELALALEWRIRTGGAEALAFDVACLSGPRAALPHGSPGKRAVAEDEVLLFDFGAQVEGYRSDMTRTLFVGEPSARDLELYELVASAQRAALDALEEALTARRPATDREIDAAARSVIEAAGHGDHFGHGLGHGIGLATHELPSLGRTGGARLPSPTVFSVEPGVYLDGVTGVRIEDLVAYDTEAATLDPDALPANGHGRRRLRSLEGARCGCRRTDGSDITAVARTLARWHVTSPGRPIDHQLGQMSTPGDARPCGLASVATRMGQMSIPGGP